MRKLAILADFENSRAVWNAIRMHIDLLIECNCSICIYVKSNGSKQIIEDRYMKFVTTYMNERELKSLLKADVNLYAIWCPTIWSVLKSPKIKGVKKIFWVQGTLPHESFLRNRSKIRMKILSYLERIAFKIADNFVFVSEAMFSFYKDKYPIKRKKSIICPCLSELNEYEGVKRIPESFVYIGGLSEWQCIDETLLFYKNIRTVNSVFHIITLDVEKAKEKVSLIIGDNINIRIYSIKDRTKISECLSQFQYGFLIRKDSPVNYVASPIKFLEYLSCGVNVIMTDAVPSYSRLVKKFNLGTVIREDSFELNNFNPNVGVFYKEYFKQQQFVSLYKELIDN